MKCLVLKPFGYAHDHIHGRDLEVGSTEEIDDDVIQGLVDAGLIEKPAELAAAEGAKRACDAANLIATVETDDWQQWSAKAKSVIGEGAPAKKAELLAALKAIAGAKAQAAPAQPAT
jgi:hypothetical protein